MNRKNNGITLIALIVTIVVLLILAGITLNIVLSEGGIIPKAQSSKEKQEIAQWLDRLTITEVNTAVINYAVDMEKYNKQLEAEGIINKGKNSYELSEDGVSYDLTTEEGYVFNISEPTPGDIVINGKGKMKDLPPSIMKLEAIEKTTNYIKSQVKVKNLQDGKITYYYKKQTDKEYIEHKETTELTIEIMGLTHNEIYDIRAIAENKNGKSKEKTISVLTGKLEEGTISQKGPTVWENEKASIELQTTDTVNTMQYQKNSINGTWEKYTGVITGLSHQDIVYARMWDGTNGTSAYSVTILDKLAPQNATINLDKTITDTNSPITATITQRDDESGVNVTKCKWVYNTTSEKIGSEEENYTGGIFNNNPQVISLNASTIGTYYLHVLTIDKAGNKTETVTSAAITVVQLATGITVSPTSANIQINKTQQLIATITPENTQNKNVIWESDNTAVVTVNSNGLVTGKSIGTANITVKTNDGSNKTAKCTINVVNQQPTIPTVTFNSKTDTSITITARATDADNDNLIYSIYTSTSQTGSYTLKATTGATVSGTNISLTASGLSNYYTYYYYVKVSDGKQEVQSSPVSVRTYCRTTYCTNLTEKTATCTTCNGRGGNITTCTGTRTLMALASQGYSTGFRCPCGRSAVFHYGDWRCQKCGDHKDFLTCPSCGGRIEGASTCGESVNDHSCRPCSGTGSIKTCKHDKTAYHYYCSHGNNYTSQYHD